ncbi:ScaI family restriction endonuclease [Thermomonas sp.]|uniref:ScaI family restriction endonuclease n=1 Tax=Thermomonas sp. TaxID=1971895 RepID=UPI00261BE38D|nr:ScaI family restriction endonuclease [Thermomonas sp.]MCO5055746.1 ScaI family restriction endonuclease [Thermomonas sp.]
MASPYSKRKKADWKSVTSELIDQHPLKRKEISGFVLEAWEALFSSSIGKHGLKIGKHIFPKPQIIGALLHELVPAEVVATHPKKWRREEEKDDKDIVCISDDKFSIELKTSSNATQIFGNRSYAQKPTGKSKSKDGYYLAVNFEQFLPGERAPRILLIRFGWLDHTDWIGQAAATGQQARLAPETYQLKFETLFTAK